jgi:predicted alpha/beta hydrolase family esterase
MLVASDNDPLCSIDRAVEFATCWGADFHQAGDAGHINVESGHGPWPEGLLMFTRLMQRI